MRALPLALAFLLTACGPAEETAPDATDPTTAETVEAPPADDGLPADLTGLNLQVNHASGSVLRVTGVRFAGDHIAVAMAFTNGADFEQELNQYSDNNFVLRDDLGNVYNVSPPANNGDVAVPAGQSIEGEFVFLGRLHPDARQLTMITNEDHGGDADHSRDPKMTVQIPLGA